MTRSGVGTFNKLLVNFSYKIDRKPSLIEKSSVDRGFIKKVVAIEIKILFLNQMVIK